MVVADFSGKNIQLNISVKPYTEQVLEQHGTGLNYIVRTFSDNVAEEELVWHRDKSNRQIHILGGNGWQLQFDDKLPEELTVGHDYYIPKMTYHRVIKGEKDLIIRIENI